jgi:hypothetical protein
VLGNVVVELALDDDLPVLDGHLVADADVLPELAILVAVEERGAADHLRAARLEVLALPVLRPRRGDGAEARAAARLRLGLDLALERLSHGPPSRRGEP